MKIVIIKYNAGNIRSVLFALERIGAEALVTDEPDLICNADKIIFPGVGEASSAMNYLRDRKLDLLIRDLRQPVLGVCLGMQLLCAHSDENQTRCIGIFNETVKKFSDTTDQHLKVPQVGWNNIYELKSGLFAGVPQNSYTYFVHGYYVGLGETTIAKTDYIQPYSSALQRKNFFGVQFHPEKSSFAGERILKNFLQL
ncbi:MAG TPA: imidazole glycerol phosphate synthase subunit HisH [Puia sp.]|jgi:glutamine amidotransferase